MRESNRLLLPGLVILTTTTGIVSALGAPLVPAIAAQENVSLNSAQWALTATLLTAAVTAPVLGRVGAGRRRKPTMLVVLALIAFGSLLAALPLGFGGLIAGRVLQGLGLGVAPLAIAVARDALSQERSGRAASALSVASVVSAGLGFPAAGLAADLVGVKGAFAIATGVAVLAMALAVLVVPRSDAVPEHGVDWIGGLLLGSATLSGLLALSRADSWGYASAPVLTLTGAAVLLGATCAWWLFRVPSPLVDLRLALRAGVIGANVAGLLAGIGMYLMMATVVILVQSGNGVGYGLGESLAMAGLMMTPYAAASVIGSRIALWLASKVGPDLVLPLGCAAFAGANLLLVGFHDHLWQVALVMTLGGLGSGATFNTIPFLMLRVVPPAETGSALGFNLVMRFVGFAIGSALSAAVLSHYADANGHPQESGFVAGALLGVLISLVGVVCCATMARSAVRATTPTPRTVT